jgi:hypothetical protein
MPSSCRAKSRSSATSRSAKGRALAAMSRWKAATWAGVSAILVASDTSAKLA